MATALKCVSGRLIKAILGYVHHLTSFSKRPACVLRPLTVFFKKGPLASIPEVKNI